MQQATVRLRSADTEDPGWLLAPRLTYALSEPGGALGAITATAHPEHQAETVVDGACTSGINDIEATVRATARPIWSEAREHVSLSAPIRIGAPDPKSCVVTGAHYLVYPPFYGGRPSRYIDGVCKFCGLVKRSPGWVARKKSTMSQKPTVHVEVAGLPRMESTTGRLWDAALDALMHLGGGASSSLTAVASQIEGGALFNSAFPRRLEDLGYIAIERLADGDPLRWEISPSCLVDLPDGLQLVGFWPDRLVVDVLDVLAPLGGQLVKRRPDGQPSRRGIEGVAPETAADAVGNLVTVSTDVTSAILSVLPPLSEVALQLDREPMPGFSQAERYHVASSSWVQTNDVTNPGGYRLSRGFERIHTFRSERDVEDGLAARGSVYLVKHLAANALGKSLVMFLPKRQQVVVPRGCDLPGLYARAVVMASGQLPQAGKVPVGEERRNCLVYRDVRQDQADLLVTLLSR